MNTPSDTRPGRLPFAEVNRSNLPLACVKLVPLFMSCEQYRTARAAYRRASHVMRFELRAQSLAR